MTMKRIWAFLLMGVMLLGMISVPAQAAENEYAVVSGSATLNLRAQPSASSQWLGRAFEGDWVQILTHEDNGWHYCRVVETGAYGYMAGNYLTTASENSVGSTGVVKNPVASQFLNLRQYPSYSADVMGIYYNGAKFSVLGYENGWYQVRTSSGQTGYFRKEFVQVTGSVSSGNAVVRTGNSGKLNLRNAPSKQGGIMAQYVNCTQVQVLLKGSKFWQVKVGNTVGYMDPAFLSTGSASSAHSAPSQPVPETRGYCIVNNPRATQFLNLRQQPSTTSKVLATYKNGIRLEIIEQGEKWCKVYGKATGNIGYVMTEYVTLYGVPSTPVKTVQNGNTFVNLRSAPSKVNGAVYEKLYSGNQVIVLTPGDEWTQVRYGNTVGYMMSNFLK
ncbi:MAG: SH3 domain-containing protein [Clostridia bacterium]|nr:SH3 domain-containing protein [Clostridia bacterium]